MHGTAVTQTADKPANSLFFIFTTISSVLVDSVGSTTEPVSTNPICNRQFFVLALPNQIKSVSLVERRSAARSIASSLARALLDLFQAQTGRFPETIDRKQRRPKAAD